MNGADAFAKKNWASGEHICNICERFNKPGLILVRFDTDGKPVDYFMKYMGFRSANQIRGLFKNYSGNHVSCFGCIAANDNNMQRWESKLMFHLELFIALKIMNQL